MPTLHKRAASLGAIILILSGCSVGPDFKKPELAVPQAYKEDPTWKAAAPDEGARRGPWWEVFGDPVLNGLEERVEGANQTVRAAVANYDAARQIVRSDRTGYLPTVSAVGSADRSKPAAVQSAAGRSVATTNYSAALEGSWALDIWGRLRRTVEADVDAAQASAADLALARLSMQATLATDYVAVRVADDKIRLLEHAVEDYRRTLRITNNKYAVGVSARSDIITAQTQLDSTRAQLIEAGIGRAQFEHAIAVLVGEAPASFSLARSPSIGLAIPTIPPQLASTLLERRPDITAAERQAAAANARIGIQVAAYYPAISLSGEAGFEGSPLDKLITAPFRFWTLGAQAADTVLDWGQRHDLVKSARAQYESSAATYRQTVLAALEQVEDNLSALRILAEEGKVEDAAVAEAAQASQIALNEYNAGTVDFTTVAAAQVTELNNRETALSIIQSRLSASVALIQALGGGWDESQLPRP